MLELLKIFLPIILQYLPTLFNKPKAAMIEWCDGGAKAAIAQKLPFNAWIMSSLKCAHETMDDVQYGDICRAVSVAGQLAKGVTEKQAAAAGIGG